MKRWIRLYTDVPDDAKVQKLPPQAFKAWINCLCLAGNNDGILPPVSDLGWRLKLSQPAAEKAIQQLIDAGLIDDADGILMPHAWSERQYDSDSPTERVKRFRERQVERYGNVSSSVTETEENVSSGVSCNVSPSVSVSVLSNKENLEGKEKKESKRLRRSHSGIAWRSDKQRESFEEFWEHYWRKVDKHAAMKAYAAKVTTVNTHAAVMAGLMAQLPGMLEREEDKRPHASTWINHQRWLDEISTEPARGPKSTLERTMEQI